MKDDDLLTRLGNIARERERDTAQEQARPSLQLRDQAALRDAIVAQALAAKRAPRASRFARVGWGAGLAAAAAVLLMWLVRPGEQPLPPYALNHQGGLEQARGSGDAYVLRLGPRSRLELQLKPQRDIAGPLELRLYTQRGARVTRLTPDHLDHSKTGGFRARLLASEHFGTSPGAFQILALVCRPASCERAQAALRSPSTSTDPAWQVLRMAAVYAQ